MGTTSQESPKAGGLLLATILVGQFLAILNVNIVNVATPTIESDLHSSGAGLQMIIAGYTIVYAVLLITGARIGDLFGYRRAFLGGLAAFTVTTLAAGLAPTTGWLVAARLLQGAGAAMMMPQVLTLIQRNFQGAARGRAIGLWSLMISGGIVAGQALGGILLGLGLGWRVVFLAVVPIALLLLVAGARLLPADHGGGRGGLDPLGLVTLSAAVLLFVVPLVLGRDLGWPLWGWISMGLSVVMFAVFVRVERWVTGRGGRPLVDARVLRAPGMRPGLAVLLFGPATWGAFLFTSALHLQGDLHMTPLASGMMLVPCALAFGLVGLAWPRLPLRLQRPLVPFGYVLAAPRVHRPRPRRGRRLPVRPDGRPRRRGTRRTGRGDEHGHRKGGRRLRGGRQRRPPDGDADRPGHRSRRHRHPVHLPGHRILFHGLHDHGRRHGRPRRPGRPQLPLPRTPPQADPLMTGEPASFHGRGPLAWHGEAHDPPATGARRAC
ncbi:hypothetical protein GCM10020001_050790 [Nonomuraea salmonea]